MKIKPPKFSGQEGEDPDAWIRKFNRVAQSNRWTADDVKVANALVALRGSADRWASSGETDFTAGGVTWEMFERAFLERWRPINFQEQLRSELYAIKQQPEEPILEYAERYREASRLLAREIESDYEAMVDHNRRIWIKGLAEPVRNQISAFNVNTFNEAVEKARNAERYNDGAARTTAVHVLRPKKGNVKKDPMEALDKLREDLADMNLMAVPIQQPEAGKAQLTAGVQVSSNQIQCFNCGQYGHIAPNCRNQRMTGLRTPQMQVNRGRFGNGNRRGNAYRRNFNRPQNGSYRNVPVCDYCGKRGHVAARCFQKNQSVEQTVQNSRPAEANLATHVKDKRNEYVSDDSDTDDDGNETGDEILLSCDSDDELENQGMMARVERNKKKAKPDQPKVVPDAKPPEPTAKKKPRKRTQPVLEAAWLKLVEEEWKIPNGMFKGKSRREVYTQVALAVREVFGRKRSQAQTSMMALAVTENRPQFGGYLDGKPIFNVIIDPGSTRSLLAQDFADQSRISYWRGVNFSIRLANGAVEKPVGMTDEISVDIAGVVVKLKFPVINARGIYSLLLGSNWLQRVHATADYVRKEYRIESARRRIFLKNSPQGCMIVRTEWKQPEVVTNMNDDSVGTIVEITDSESESDSDSESDDRSDNADNDDEDSFDPDGWKDADLFGIDGFLAGIPEHDVKEAEFQISDDLSQESRKELIDLLERYRSTFATVLSDVGRTNLIEHHIRVPPGTRPIYRPGVKRFSQPELKFIEQELQKQLEAGIIRENDGPWCAPVTLAMKKNGKYRFCVAYIGLNSVTERESWPLPNIEEILDNLAGYDYYSTLDGFSGFNTIPIREEDRHLTTFRTPFGTYCYNMMPFGLKNAPHTYCRYVYTVFRSLLGRCVQTYMDDVAVYSRTLDDHFRDLKDTFELSSAGNMKINPTKAHFACQSVEFLGHVISKQGIAVMPSRIKCIQNCKRPEDPTGIRSFLGLTGHYRRFIQYYAHKSSPLTSLTRKKTTWHWGEAQEKAFREMIHSLTTAPVLRPPNWNKSWIVDCDASGEAVGSVLSQIGDDEEEHPVYYYSRLLNNAERNYSATDRECLAVIAAMKKFRVYILGRSVLIRTDHSALRQLLNRGEATGRYARWMCILSEFDYTLQHRPGRLHGNADGMSRLKTEPEIREEGIDDTCPEYALRAVVNEDPWYRDVVTYLLGESLRHLPESQRRRVRTMARKFVLKGEDLFHLDLLGELKSCVSESEVPTVLSQYHEQAGHWGFDVTLANLKQSFYWPTMREDVKKHVRNCRNCQLYRKDYRTNELRPTWVVDPFDVLYVDWITKLPKTTTGNECIIVCTDALTKWTEAKAYPTADSHNGATFLTEQIVCRYGTPIIVSTDNGSHFRKHFSELLAQLNTRHVFGSPYHPQSQGQVEKTNGLIIDRLRKTTLEYQNEWDKHLPAIVLTLNNRTSKRMKISPMMALIGRKVSHPLQTFVTHVLIEDYEKIFQTLKTNPCHEERLRILDSIRDEALEITRRINLEMMRKYNKGVKPRSFEVGDVVLMKIQNPQMEGRGRKFQTRWIGPGTVVWTTHGAAGVMNAKHQVVIYNQDHLKHYCY